MRALLRKPWFSAMSIVTLALGIAACTVVFSLVNAVLLQPLPYRNAARVVTLLHPPASPVSPADFTDWKKQVRSLDAMEAAFVWGAVLAGEDGAEQVTGLQMTAGMFGLLGDSAALGRTFTPDDRKVVVLGDSLWRRRFGANPAVIGTSIRLNNEAYTVVGVMPPGFRFPPFWATSAELWVPADLSRLPASRGARMLRVFGRMAPGADLGRVQSELDSLAAQTAAAYPDTNAGLKIVVSTLADKAAGTARTPLLVLFGAVALLLLIGCSNVASVMLARALERRREVAVRLAVGASTLDIVRQLLAESLTMSLAGGLLGAALAAFAVQSLRGLLDGVTAGTARLGDVQLDWTVLLFAAGVSVLTGLLFGMAPAWQAAHTDVNTSLRDGSRGASEGAGGMRLRNALVVGQTALCLVLLAGAGMLLRSYVGLRAVQPGFDSRNLLTMTVSGASADATYDRIVESVSAIPGVVAVGLANHLPVGGDTWSTRVAAEGAPLARAGEELSAVYRVARPGYLAAMGIPLTTGRDFAPTDREGASRAVIVNTRLARMLWPGQDPVGKRLTMNDPRKDPEWLTVVGVIPDVRQDDLRHDAAAELYVAYAQVTPRPREMTLVARTAGDPMSLAAAVRGAVSRIDKDVALARVRSADRILDTLLWQARMTAVVTSVFAALALLLACVGIYGVMAFLAGSRSREIGIRMALGATRAGVVALFVRHGLVLVGSGVALGLAASLLALRTASSLFYGITAGDPVALSTAPLALLLAGALALLAPAWRAARTSAADVLRG